MCQTSKAPFFLTLFFAGRHFRSRKQNKTTNSYSSSNAHTHTLSLKMPTIVSVLYCGAWGYASKYVSSSSSLLKKQNVFKKRTFWNSENQFFLLFQNVFCVRLIIAFAALIEFDLALNEFVRSLEVVVLKARREFARDWNSLRVCAFSAPRQMSRHRWNSWWLSGCVFFFKTNLI